VLAELGQHQQAVRLLGAAEAMRERNANPRPPGQEAEIGEPSLRPEHIHPKRTWRLEYETGYAMTIEDALTGAQTASQNRRG
jgi:hypothetical protein